MIMKHYLSLITAIQQKKPLDRLDASFVQQFLDRYFQQHPNDLKKLELVSEAHLARNALFKKIVKEVRSELNRIYGVFWKSPILALGAHLSTNERLHIYPKLYSSIFKKTGVPESILDVAAGLNPLSYSYLQTAGFTGTYTAVELSPSDCSLLQDYFTQSKIHGTVLCANLYTLPKLPSAQMCFLFKVFDVLEMKGHIFSERLIDSLDTSWIVASFSTTTIKGQRMRHPQRGWIEQLCKRKGYSFSTLLYENEIFYLIQCR